MVKVKPGLKKKIDNYADAFHDVFWQYGLSVTTKVHIIIEHCLDFVKYTSL